MKKNNLGISLISLIVTIIVIIILAAIVIFTGLGTPDQANFASFVSEFSDFELAVTNDYMNRFTNYSVSGQTRSKAQIYYEIASGVDVGINGDPMEVDTIENLGLNILPEGLKGKEYYEIVDDTNVKNWKSQSQYFEAAEKHYVTDEGDVFFLPGYLVEEKDGSKRWWISENQYYIADNGVRGPSSIEVSNIKITTDSAGTVEAGNDVTKGTTLYINFSASEEGASVTVSPSLPYEVTTNGTYSFTLTSSSGKTKTYTVTVDNYDIPTIASSGIEIGDYVKYQGDSSNSYTLYASKTGYPAQDGTPLTPISTSWRVWDIKANGDIVIMPEAPVNSFYLSGDTGFINSVDIIEDVCDLYTNSSLGVDSGDVESLTIEDLEDTRVSSDLATTRDNYTNYGKTNAEQYGNAGYTSGKFYTKEDGVTITKTPRVASSTNPIIVKQTYYLATSLTWNSLGSSKFSSATYGTLLGGSYGWLASPCVDCRSSYAYFDVRRARSSNVGSSNLYSSYGSASSVSYGVRPLVSLSSTLPINGGDGKESTTGWEF